MVSASSKSTDWFGLLIQTRGAAHQRTFTLKFKNMKASKLIKYLVYTAIVLAILNYCQELNDCLMRY
jgi:hypothetical protein